MNEMNSIQMKLNAARTELLDLGSRNPLINYRLSKARGVEVVDESPPDIYRILVQDGKAMSFLQSLNLKKMTTFNCLKMMRWRKILLGIPTVGFKRTIHQRNFKGVC